MRNRLAVWALVVGLALLLGAFWAPATLAEGAAAVSLANGAEIEMSIFPPIISPGGRIPVSWEITGGTTVSETYLLWDVVMREHRDDYMFQTEAQSGGSGIYYDDLLIPEDAQSIHIKPYAMVDGSEILGGFETVIRTTYALNVGDDIYGLDANGLYWHPDREIDLSPTWYEFEGDDKLEVEREIAGTADDWIYRSQRQGLSSFRAWLGNDVYSTTLEVGLHLAELEADGPGQRVFDVIIEEGTANEVVIPGIDVFDLAGGMDTAVTISRTVHVNVVPDVDEHLNLTFSGQAGAAPILNGVAVRGVDAVPMYKVHRAGGTGNDDTYTGPTGTFTGADEVWLGGDGQYHGGLRFPALRMPQGAQIWWAWLEVTAAEDASMNTLLDVYAHAADSSPSFASQAVVPNRARTEIVVPWDMPGDNWIAGRSYTAPDLAALVQEIVDREGWVDANALSLLLIAGEGDTNAPRKIWSYEGEFDQRARLTIYYSRQEDLPEPPPEPAGLIYMPLVLKTS